MQMTPSDSIVVGYCSGVTRVLEYCSGVTKGWCADFDQS